MRADCDRIFYGCFGKLLHEPAAGRDDADVTGQRTYEG